MQPSEPTRAASTQELAFHAALDAVETYRKALIRCAELAGADMSGGVPTWPSLDVWAVQEVEQLRKDYDEAIS